MKLSGKVAPIPGFTGEKLLNTPVFLDGNIPTTGSGAKTQILVSHMPEIFTLASSPALRAFPDTEANTLSVVIQLYGYVGVVARHAQATQILSGAAYVPSPTFA